MFFFFNFNWRLITLQYCGGFYHFLDIIQLHTSWSEEVKVAQSCLTLCNPMGCTVCGFLQARILEWVAFPFSRRSSQPRHWTHVSRTGGRFFTSFRCSRKLYSSFHYLFILHVVLYIYIYICHYLFLKDTFWEFPGGPVVKTLPFHFRECRFSPWLRNCMDWGTTSCMAWPKKKRKEGRKTHTIKIHKFPNKLYHDMYYFKCKLNSKKF